MAEADKVNNSFFSYFNVMPHFISHYQEPNKSAINYYLINLLLEVLDRYLIYEAVFNKIWRRTNVQRS